MGLKERPIPAILMLCLGLAGCAVTSADGERLRPGSDAFADYVEAVFRRQNQLQIELALALDDANPDSERYQALEVVELELLTICRPLNELAAQRGAGESTGGPGALKRARQAPACERAAEKAAALL
jgi:hypothetical protein